MGNLLVQYMSVCNSFLDLNESFWKGSNSFFILIIFPFIFGIEERFIQKQRQRSSRLFEGSEFIKFLALLAILLRSIWKNTVGWIQPIHPK